jgi:uncharacterized RDD family membrane protein YckC
MPVRTLSLEPLTVDPLLIGQPVASPGRRLLAFVIDGLLLSVPTVAAAVGAAGLSLYLSDRPSFDAIRHLSRLSDSNPAVALAEARQLVPLLVRLDAPGLPAAVTAAYEEGDLDRAAAILGRHNILITVQLVEEEAEQVAPAGTVKLSIERLIPGPIRATALLFVPGAYFVLFARSRRGATIGKRLLGLRVVRLDGRRLGWMEAVERFTGYLQVPASAFLGLADLWWDRNRRMSHDRSAHTAVLAGRRTPARARASAGR